VWSDKGDIQLQQGFITSVLVIGVGRYWRFGGWYDCEKFQTTPILGQTAPIFERSTLLRLDFLHKRTNGRSSRADLAAT